MSLKGCTLNEQERQLFRLDFTFSDISTGVNFSPFSSFWQTNPNSFQFGGSESGNGDDGTLDVPEPATLGLLGLGMLAMGALRRRKVALKR